MEHKLHKRCDMTFFLDLFFGAPALTVELLGKNSSSDCTRRSVLGNDSRSPGKQSAYLLSMS